MIRESCRYRHGTEGSWVDLVGGSEKGKSSKGYCSNEYSVLVYRPWYSQQAVTVSFYSGCSSTRGRWPSYRVGNSHSSPWTRKYVEYKPRNIERGHTWIPYQLRHFWECQLLGCCRHSSGQRTFIGMAPRPLSFTPWATRRQARMRRFELSVVRTLQELQELVH